MLTCLCMYSIVHHLNNKLVCKNIRKQPKQIIQKQRSRNTASKNRIYEWICLPWKIDCFHFIKVILQYINVSTLNFILVVCFDILCFFSRPLIKILRAPEPKNPLAGLGLGGDLPNTFQQLATMFMQSAKGRHQLGTLNTFCQLETWKKREFKHDHTIFSHFN